MRSHFSRSGRPDVTAVTIGGVECEVISVHADTAVVRLDPVSTDPNQALENLEVALVTSAGSATWSSVELGWMSAPVPEPIPEISVERDGEGRIEAIRIRAAQGLPGEKLLEALQDILNQPCCEDLKIQIESEQ